MSQGRDRILNCFCCVLMLFVNMGVVSSSFSAYFPYIREIKGFSNTQVFLLTTMRQIFAMIVMTRSDSYYQKLDIKRGTILTFLLVAVSFGILAFAPDARLYYLATSFFGISYGLGGMIPASILLRRWFTEGSGTAIGIAAAGSGIAAMVVPLQVTHLVERYGLSTAFAVQGAVILVMTVPLVLFLKNHPEEREAVPVSDKETQPVVNTGDPAAAQPAFRLAEHPRLVVGMIIMGLLAYQASSGFSMLFRTSGYEMERVALLLSALGLFLIPAKILVGRFADHFGGRRMLRDCTLLVSAALFMFSLSAFLPYPVLFLLLLVFAAGISESTVGVSVIAGDFAPAGTYAKVLKNCQFCYALGGLLFSTSNGVIADLTGSYAPAYAIYGAAALVMLAVLLPGYPQRNHQGAGEDRDSTQ